MTNLRTFAFAHSPPAGWLLAAWLLAVGGPVEVRAAQTPTPGPSPLRVVVLEGPDGAAEQVAALPPVPKPTPAHRAELAAAFTRPAPASIADLKDMEQQVKALVARVSPAVVEVEVGNGSGSGVVISADGLVLTAGHVCGAAGRAVRFVFPDGKTAQGLTLGLNRTTDTGLMRITNRGVWPHAAVGDLEHGRVGDWVLALGHPGGFDRQRSLVVRLGRIIQLTPEILQTDCTITGGDSGGPLFDMHGRVIGIHSYISESMADNFHVPIGKFYAAWDQLVSGETGGRSAARPRAYVGARGVDAADGCRLAAVDKPSPAAKAGLQKGDLVLTVNGRLIKAAAFRRWVAEAEPGETLHLEIQRGDKVMALAVKLEQEPRRP